MPDGEGFPRKADGSRKKGDLGNQSAAAARSFNAFHLAKQFVRVARTYFVGDLKWQARGLLALLVLVACGGTGMHVVISYNRKDFANALTDKNAGAFYKVVLRFVGLIVFAAPFIAFAEFVQGRMVLEWRLWLTNLLLGKYFANKAFFNLKLEGVLDNPDQRICEDVKNFVDSSVAVIKMLVEKVLTVVAFSAVLWSISPSVVAFLLTYAVLGTYITLHLFGKKMMQLKFEGLQREADFRYSLVRVRDNVESIAFYRGEQSEAASVRGFLGRLAENTLQQLSWNFFLEVFTNGYRFATFIIPGLVLAPRLFRGEVTYGDVVQTSMAFHEIFRAVTVIVLKFDILSSLAAETERLESLLSALGMSPDAKAAEFCCVSSRYRQQSRSEGFLEDLLQTTSKVLSSLRLSSSSPGSVPKSTLIQTGRLRKAFSDDEGSQKNLSSKVFEMEDFGGDESVPEEIRPLVPVGASSADSTESSTDHDKKVGEASFSDTINRIPSDRLVVTGLKIYLPSTGQVLFRSGLSFELEPGQSLLVMGPSGCGKSSLLRVISGLWKQGKGSIASPAAEDTFFLPQRPYMPLGSLREQLLFPHNSKLASQLDDFQLEELLEKVSLPELVSRFRGGLDEVCDWSATLSMGEQQRVAFARLLLHQPPMAFMDEATSALDTVNERRLYKLIGECIPSYVSVGHRLSLVPYHSHVLSYDSEKRLWSMVSAGEFSQLNALHLQVN